MITNEDKANYIRLVSNLTPLLLKKELLEAKEKNNSYNDLAISDTPLNEGMENLCSLAFDILNGANSNFEKHLVDNE